MARSIVHAWDSLWQTVTHCGLGLRYFGAYDNREITTCEQNLLDALDELNKSNLTIRQIGAIETVIFSVAHRFREIEEERREDIQKRAQS